MSNFDAIIIGSGVGGLALGGLLASNQIKTQVIEKHKIIGGRCSTYEKNGFKIDFGVHLFAGSHKGPIGKVLRMIGMQDAINWNIIKNGEAYWHVNGNFYQLPNDFRKIIPKKDILGLLKLLDDTEKIKDTHELDTIDVKSWLSQYTSNTLVHAYFYVNCGLNFVIPYHIASTGEFIRCLTMLDKYKSVGYPRGGCISVPLAFAEGIKNYGGSIKTETNVDKIVIENNKVQGVELDNGDFISSNVVISNAGIQETINNLIGRKYFKISYLKEIDKLRYSLSAFTLKLALKKPISSDKMVVSFTPEDPEEKYKSIAKGNVPDEVDLFIPIPSNCHSSMAPQGHQLITTGTQVLKENFEKNKKKWIENSLNTLENIFPELSKNLLWYDVTTPQDIEKMWGKEASLIGISQNTEQVGINRPSVSLPIEGLYMVGGDAGGWGIGTELAVESALECSEIILKKF